MNRNRPFLFKRFWCNLIFTVLPYFIFFAAFMLVCCEKGLQEPPPPSEYYDFTENFERAIDRSPTQFVDIGSKAAGSHLGKGWSRPEKTGKGFTYTYTLGKKSVFNFHLGDKLPTALTFRAKSFEYPGAEMQRVKVRLNGKKLGEVELGAKFSSPVLKIPPDALKTGKNEIVFEFSRAVRPSDFKPESTDKRNISAMFDYIALFRSAEELQRLVKQGGRGLSLIGSSGEESKALVFPVDSVLAFPLRIFKNTVMKLEWGVVSKKAEGPVRLKIFRRDVSGEKALVFERKIPAKRLPGKMLSEEIDLGELEAGIGEIEFNVEKSPDEAALVINSGKLLSSTPSTNILLIVADALRADRLSCYGGPVNTPNLDRLAEEGVLFKRAYTAYPVTPPSFSSIFTGKLPAHHGVRSFGGYLTGDQKTLVEIINPFYQKKVGFAGLAVLSERLGLWRGFDERHMVCTDNCWKFPAEEVNREVIKWLDANRNEQFFMFIHYADPHSPYAMPGSIEMNISVSMDDKKVHEQKLTYHECVEVPVNLSPGKHRLVIEASAPKRCEERMSAREKKFVLVSRLGNNVQVSTLNGKAPENKVWMFNNVEIICGKPLEVQFDYTGNKPVEKVFEFMPLVVGGRSDKCPGGERLEAYHKEISYLDEQVGALIDVLKEKKVLDKTVIIFTSDHGEEFGEHGYSGHGPGLYVQSLHVPMIWRAPWVFGPGKKVEKSVRLIDIAPTILDIIELPRPPSMDGNSLMPMLEEKAADRPVVTETKPEGDRDRLYSLISGKWHLIVHEDDTYPELYDIEKDPGEQKNVAKSHITLVNRLERKLEELLSGKQIERKEELDAETKAKLRAMGYVE